MSLNQVTKMVIGVDPGATGAMVAITKERRVKLFRFINKTEQEITDAVWDYSIVIGEVVPYLESVHSMPTDGKATAFVFGSNFGYIRGCLASHICYPTFVTPQQWQLALKLGGRHCERGASRGQKQSARKRAHKALAQKLFPSFDITLDSCDAFLIAQYGWLKTFGG